MNMLTQERLKQFLDYNPETGLFSWAKNRVSMKGIHTNVGTIRSTDGYRQVSVDSVLYRAHRLAFLWMTGRWPTAFVDHKNGLRDDNRWNNLREATRQQNRGNTALFITNTSGRQGVYKVGNRWRARIVREGVCKHLGYFDTLGEAASAYDDAELAFYGEYASSLREVSSGN